MDVHRAVADERGRVWWGLLGDARPSVQRLRELRLELEGGADLLAYLYETGSARAEGRSTRARVLEITTDAAEVTDNLLPTYYSKSECALFLLLEVFVDLPPGWPADNLALAGQPDASRRWASKSN